MNNERNKKVEEILDSLNGTHRAIMPVFFYTRLKARMEKGLEVGSRRPWLLRPAYAMITLVVVLLINTAVILKSDSPNDTIADTDTETTQSIAAEYSLNDNNAILFDINQDR